MIPLLAFFALTFIVSWTFFGIAAGITSGPALANHPVFLVGVFAPALVAVAMTATAGGRGAVAALLGRVLHAPGDLRWYGFAAGFMAAIKLTTAVVLRMATGRWPPFGQESLVLMALATVISTPVQAGEEIGWRGFALPRLARAVGLPAASIVLGIIWAAWHLPLFFIPGVDKTGQSFPVYLLGVTALSVAMAWLYWRTQASLLLTMLLHAAVNNTTGIVPSARADAVDPWSWRASPTAWVSVALLWLCAAYFLIEMRGAMLPRSEVRSDAVGSSVS